ncbi:hypothetical protein MNBD_ALPHA06-503 [hydrothermal vent metagenome]|uniref:Death on curing protein, Doc toxin n=1 Tax=hydrothermal vent metagenome TaxID=652676 RepID=A0A3B0SZ79_9ZZZZ
MGFNLTQIAKEQLIDCYVYGFENFGETQAEQYQQDMMACFGLLSKNPRLAHVRKGYNRPLRIHHHVKHYIVYLLVEETEDILIVAVLRDSMDLVRHFDE